MLHIKSPQALGAVVEAVHVRTLVHCFQVLPHNYQYVYSISSKMNVNDGYLEVTTCLLIKINLPDCQEWVQMGLVGVQVSVVETAEKEMQKTVVGTFLVGQAEKYDCVLPKA